MGHAIRASDLRLAWIDVSMPGFLAQEDLSPVELPLHHALLEAAASREETISSRLSLDEEIDQFQLEEEKEEKGAPIIPILDAEDEFDRFLGVQTLNPRKGLRDLMARRNKGSSSKEVPKSQAPANLPPPLPSPITTLGLLLIPNLKKKMKEQEMEEGEMVP